jgi:ketosteroid isomerase-like protein
MSQEELDLATRAIRAVSARPKPDFATMNEVFQPDHVFVPAIKQIEGDEYHGGHGFQQFIREASGPAGATDSPLSWEADFVGAIDVGNHKVIGITTNRYRASASGMQFDQRTWVVMTVRNGRISRTETYTDPNEALKAALSEQDAHADS